ncbi:hypothetical protein Hanom_Chr12g01073721 [Helianthus anomalus]
MRQGRSEKRRETTAMPPSAAAETIPQPRFGSVAVGCFEFPLGSGLFCRWFRSRVQVNSSRQLGFKSRFRFAFEFVSGNRSRAFAALSLLV